MSLVEELQNGLLNALFTGSRKFWCHTDKSDWDFCVLKEDWDKDSLRKALRREFDWRSCSVSGEQEGGDFNAYRAIIGGQDINIIVLKDKLMMEAYRFATDTMFKHVQENGPGMYMSKPIRVRNFRRLKQQYIDENSVKATPLGIMGMFRKKFEGICPSCDKDMRNARRSDFKDDLSYKEFGISGFCQECQDKTFVDNE